MKIKDLPELERPREKAHHYGINKLSNIELLALIIGSGGPNNNVLMVATSLMSKVQSISGLIDLSFQDYLSINGIKTATAFRFLAIGELLKRQGMSDKVINYQDSESIAKRYRYIIGHNKTESMYLIAINDGGALLFEKELYKGTKKSCISSEEEIIDELKKEKAHFFLLIHNHPSGNTSPSEDDIISTNHLLVRARDSNLLLLDHIIVCSNLNYYSFKEHKQLV